VFSIVYKTIIKEMCVISMSIANKGKQILLNVEMELDKTNSIK